jgi:hypothetical protein
MPFFSTEDIGVYGALLLLTSCLKSVCPPNGGHSPRNIIFGVGFSLVNAAIYRCYGMELIPALFYAAIMSALLIAILQSLEDSECLTHKRFVALSAAAALLCALLVIELFVEGTAASLIAGAETLIWFAVLTYLFIRIWKALSGRKVEAVPLGIAVFLICILTMYTTYDPWFAIADILSAIVVFPLVVAVSRTGDAK